MTLSWVEVRMTEPPSSTEVLEAEYSAESSELVILVSKVTGAEVEVPSVAVTLMGVMLWAIPGLKKIC